MASRTASYFHYKDHKSIINQTNQRDEELEQVSHLISEEEEREHESKPELVQNPQP
jgi:hypothetical protein